MAIVSRFWRGWAVEAVFGRTTAHQRTLFLSLIGAAIVWPVLLFGILVPKLAVQVISFVPLPETVPNWTVRVVWIALAVLIPIGVGVAVTIKAPRATGHRPLVIRVLCGFPITVGLTVSFGIILIGFPVMRFAGLVRKQKSIDIPLIMDAAAYRQIADHICDVLNRQGFLFRPAEAGWWMSIPIRLLARMGGELLRSHLPARFMHFVDEDLTMSLYPSGLLLRGKPERLTMAHGLIAEWIVHTDGLQTMDPKALALERRLRPLWRRYDDGPEDAMHDETLLRELGRVTQDLKVLQIGWEDWQVLYRQILQLARAVHGELPLFEGKLPPLVPGRPCSRQCTEQRTQK
jgi:hypothetical protein